MNKRNIFSFEIKEENKKDFQEEITLINIKRGITFSGIMILFEMILLLSGCIVNFWPHLWQRTVNTEFIFTAYYKMYVLMLIAAVFYLLIFYYLKKRFEQAHIESNKTRIAVITGITFVMLWGAVISLFDQYSYGNVLVYTVNVMLGSMIFYLEPKYLIIPYSLSLAVLAIGLPYFQESSYVLFGHYVNIGMFMVLIWVMAISNYSNFKKDFINRALIKEKNTKLENEISTREIIQQQLEEANQKLLDLSFSDTLTGIPNRRKLQEVLDYEWKRALRDKTSISLIMIDIDFFKSFNDNYGHLAGDNCLISVARALYSCRRRSTDFIARYGGEEFIFLAINLDKEGTLILAEKLRQSVAGLKIPHEHSAVADHLTISLGLTTAIPEENASFSQAIANADQALYRAIHDGRNLVRSYPELF